MYEINLIHQVEHIESLVQSGEFDRAHTQNEELLATYPRFWRAIRLRGMIDQAQEAWINAVRHFEQVLHVVPEDAASHDALATIYLQHGDSKQARFHALLHLDQQPADLAARDRFRQISTGDQNPRTGKVEITDGMRAYYAVEKSSPKQAAMAFQKALEKESSRLDLQAVLARMAWLAGNEALAFDVAEKLMRRAPLSLVANLLLGYRDLEAGQFITAYNHVDLAEQTEPTHELATALFGEALVVPTEHGLQFAAIYPVAQAHMTEEPTPPWVSYLLGRTRAELTSRPPAAPLPTAETSPHAVDTVAPQRPSSVANGTAPTAPPNATSAATDDVGPLADAEAARNTGRYDEAIALYDALLGNAASHDLAQRSLQSWAAQPDAPALLYRLLGDRARANGDPLAAVALYRKAYEQR